MRFKEFPKKYASSTILELEKRQNIEELIKLLSKRKRPLYIKEDLLKINQLYFNGILEEQTNKSKSEKLNLLNIIFHTTQKALKQYYEKNQEINKQEILESLMPYDSQIIEYASKEKSKIRHLQGEDKKIAKKINCIINELNNQEIDTIIPIASGGFESALLLENYLKTNNIFPIRYSRIGKRDEYILTPENPNKIYGKNILIMEDSINTGKTKTKVTEWVQKHSPKELHFEYIEKTYQNTKI